jgi:superfamily II DNA or RNA helicase
MPLYKKGAWDGVKKFFNWRYGYFAPGLIPYVEKKLNAKVVIESDDRLKLKLDYYPVQVNGSPLRDFQEYTIKELLKNNGGLAALATNAGKTACIAGVIKSLIAQEKKVMVVVMRSDLQRQIKADLEQMLGLSIGVITPKEKELQDVSVAMVQTLDRVLSRLDNETDKGKDIDIFDYIQQVDAIIIDEVHHATSDSYEKIFQLNNRALRFGFSGTIPEDTCIEGLHIREQLGEVVCRVSNKELIEKGISATPKITFVEYETDFAGSGLEAVKIAARKSSMIKGKFSVPTYTNKVRHWVLDYAINKNKEYWEILKKLVEKYKNESVIIMVDWKEFADNLSAFLNIPVFYGETKTKERIQLIQDFKDRKIKHLIVTSVLDEGLSIDQIQVIILATCGSSPRQFLQRLGRGLRKKVGENILTLIDFCRYGHKYLLEPSKKRLALWKKEGFDIKFEEVI